MVGLWNRQVICLKEKCFSLFNTSRWTPENKPECCHVAPVLYKGVFNALEIENCIIKLRVEGSSAAPGFMKPEGIIIYHVPGDVFFKRLLEHDDVPKSLVVPEESLYASRPKC